MQTEMHKRWFIGEHMLHDILMQCKQNRNFERAVREIDQVIAAVTLRGDVFKDTSKECVEDIWKIYELRAIQKYPNDKTVKNNLKEN